jgi:hypothetical protein
LRKGQQWHPFFLLPKGNKKKDIAYGLTPTVVGVAPCIKLAALYSDKITPLPLPFPLTYCVRPKIKDYFI